MSTKKYQALGILTACALLPSSILPPSGADAAERPTMNKRTCDPRPDILIHPLYNAHTEYRRQYNRPRFVPGWIAYKIAPTSQEAMVWCENLHAGSYDNHHSPPRFKRYYAPKPWEVLTTGPRPDTKKAEPVATTTDDTVNNSTEAKPAIQTAGVRPARIR